MLDILIPSKTRFNLLIKFFLVQGTMSYLRMLEKEFNESTNALRVELIRMEEAKLLISENLNLLTSGIKLKNAALLLFGKKPSKFFPSVSFKIGRFIAGDDDLRYQDIVEGNILQMADNAKKSQTKDNVTGNVPDKVPDKVPDRVPDNLTGNQQKILKLFAQNKTVSMSEIANNIGISKRKVLDNINKLKKLGLIHRIGSPKAGHWEIINEPPQ